MYSRECNEAPGTILTGMRRAFRWAVQCWRSIAASAQCRGQRNVAVSAMSRSAQCRGQCNVASAPADVNVAALGRSHVELTWAGDLELRAVSYTHLTLPTILRV